MSSEFQGLAPLSDDTGGFVDCKVRWRYNGATD